MATPRKKAVAVPRKKSPANSRSNGRRKPATPKTPAVQDVRSQILAEDQRPGEPFTFPGTRFTVLIKPVGMHMMLMGGAVPEGYDVKKFTDTVAGQVEDITADYVEVLGVTITEICKEAVRLGWSEQYDDFVTLMLPRLEMGHLQSLFEHLQEMAMPDAAPAIFPAPALDNPA